MVVRWLILAGMLGVIAWGYWAVVIRPYQFTIPIGATVALLGRLVQVVERHTGAGIGVATDPACYVYIYVDDPPNAVTISPVWDDRGRRWTHQHAFSVSHPRGHREATQLWQFNHLADYRR